MILKKFKELSEAYIQYNGSSTILECANNESNIDDILDSIYESIGVVKECDIPKYVPFLDPIEIEESGILENMSNEELEEFFNYKKSCTVSKEWINNLREAYSSNCAIDEKKRKMLSLGWIPSVPITEEAFKSARSNLADYINSKRCDMIDLTETTKSMPDELKYQVNSYALYPVYLICTFTYTTFGSVISKFTDSSYSHAAIGFDSSLKKLYSFNVSHTNKNTGGLSFESIDQYKQDSDKSRILVQVVFLTKEKYTKLKNNLDWYIANYNKSHYSITNIFNIVVGRTKEYTKYNLNMICSQFVDVILKLSDVNLIDKPSNLVTPKDISAISNPRVYKMYEGLAKEYNPNKVKNMVLSLINNKINPINIDEMINTTSPVIISICRASYNITKASCIDEVTSPIQFDDNGDFSIDSYKSYELRYQESHNLIKTNLGLEAKKEEMAKLWYINCKLIKKIQYLKKRKLDTSKYINLRARVLNDFNKLSKQVIKEDKEFNFSKYYRLSDYNDGNLKINNSTLSNIGRLIQNIKIMM